MKGQEMDIMLNELHGNLNGDLVFAVIIFSKEDMNNSIVKFYGGNSVEEVSDFLYQEGYSDDWFVIRPAGIRILTAGDL